MNVMIRDLKEMTDSRELLEARTHPFITWFVAILGVILLAALTWAFFGEIDIVVKANGVVRPNAKVSRITSAVTGKVQDVAYKAGEKVQKGQPLYTLDLENLDDQKHDLNEQLTAADSDFRKLEAFRDEIMRKGIDSMAENVIGADQLLEGQTSAKKLQMDLISVTNNLQDTKRELDNLLTLKQSMDLNRNLFTDQESPYYNKFLDFEIKKQQFESQAQSAQEQFKKMVSDDTGGEAKRAVSDAELTLNNYVNGFTLDVKNQIEQNRQQLKGLKINQDKLLLQINDTIRQNNNQINDLNGQMQTLSTEISNRKVTAPIDGTVNVIADLSRGELLQAGTEVLSIVPDNNSEYIVQLVVQNRDIGNLHNGDRIQYNFLALPSKEYGTLKGTIQTISADARSDQQSGASYYLVDATLDNKPLYNKKGEEAMIKVGMQTEAHVITRSEKIINYLLEKLDLKQ